MLLHLFLNVRFPCQAVRETGGRQAAADSNRDVKLLESVHNVEVEM